MTSTATRVGFRDALRPVAFAALLSVLPVAAATAASPTPALKRTPILDTTLPGAPQVGNVTGTRIAFPPGQPTPLHLHPVPVVGVVTAGRFVFQPEGQPARTLRTGDAFYEPANARIARFDNASATEPAEIVAFYLAETPGQTLIQLLDPGKN